MDTSAIDDARDKIKKRTKREVSLVSSDSFKRHLLVEGGYGGGDIINYGVLAHLFPLSLASILNGEESIAETGGDILLMMRSFPDCSHVIAALYQCHPVSKGVWTSAISDHVAMWRSGACETCSTASHALKDASFSD